MTPADWERCLTAHFLRSDGPFGGSPLAYVDATPDELAVAALEFGLSADEAQDAFLSQFDRWTVQAWLDGGHYPPRTDLGVPGYFRYLVLTALVSATEEGAGQTHNFRIRLGALLGGEPLHAVSRVNALWRALGEWCDRKREAGEAFRRVLLPDPGSMTHIGVAVRIAFPSWRDRTALARVLRRLNPEMRRSPRRLVEQLSRPHLRWDLPTAVGAAFEDFKRELQLQRRMLGGHRFWTLVQSIDARLAAEAGEQVSKWTLEARFGGYEQDVLELKLFKGSGRSRSFTPRFSGELASLEILAAQELPQALSSALRDGALFFSEAPGATWVIDDQGLREDAPALIVARRDSRATAWPLVTEWRALDEKWRVSGVLNPGALTGLRQALGYARSIDNRLVDLTVEGGVRTARSMWIGRPAILPQIVAAPLSRVSLTALAGAEPLLSVSDDGPPWTLCAPGPLNGRWRASAVEAGGEAEMLLTLEADAPERWDWPAPPVSLEAETELLVTATREPSQPSALPPPTDSPLSPLLDDLLEGIYAGAGSGWAEADLVPLLEPVMPRPHFVWDFLRSLAEAGWLEPYLLKGWKARKWLLAPPRLCRLAQKLAVVEGAVGAAARRRLGEAARRLGGEFAIHSGVSAWCAPTLVVSGLDAQILAAELGWSLVRAESPTLAPAPACWPAETRTGEARRVAGVWSFSLGLFTPPERARDEGEVTLQRLVRDRSDDRDLFRVEGGGGEFFSASRTCALLEAYRRRRSPLFHWTSGRLRRRGRGGHLPLPVARALARKSLCASGAVLDDTGEWTYEYSVDSSSARWLAGAFGPAVVGPTAATRPDRLAELVAARRSRQPARWYATSRELPR